MSSKRFLKITGAVRVTVCSRQTQPGIECLYLRRSGPPEEFIFRVIKTFPLICCVPLPWPKEFNGQQSMVVDKIFMSSTSGYRKNNYSKQVTSMAGE